MIFQCLSGRFGIIFGAMLLVFGALTTPAHAVEDVFTVSGVMVDIKAENAVAAREKAFNEAQQAAFRALATRLLGEDEAKTYTLPDVGVISTMIQDFEVTDERLSAVEYIGTYTFRFDGNAVRNQFNMQGMRYTDMASRPVLVLPFIQVGERLMLWQDQNPWRDAWSRSNGQGGLVPIRVPMGDVRDMADISDDQALSYRHDGLTEILQRYNAGEAVVLVAAPGAADAGGAPSDLSVMLYRTDRGYPEYVQTLKIRPDQGATTAAALYDKAVRDVRAAIQRDWKEQAQIDPAQGGGNMTVRVNFATMQQWIETRNAMRRVPGITAMKVRSVTPREAVVDLDYTGGESRLRLALEQNDMILSAPDHQYAYGAAMVYGLSLRKYATTQAPWRGNTYP